MLVNFYKHYLGDYSRKTGHLSLAEHGAYRRLLDHYYGTGKSLPAELDALCRVCGAISPAERQAVSNVADEYFPVNGDGRRHNRRADEELKSYDEKATHSRENGKLGGRPRITQQDTQQVLEDEPRNNLKPEVRSQKLEVNKPEAGNQKKERSKALARATRLPKDWILPTVWAEWAEETLGWPNKKVYEVAEIFRDYWIAVPGAKGTKADWQATWRNWCRNQRTTGKSQTDAFAEAKRQIFGERDITDEANRV